MPKKLVVLARLNKNLTVKVIYAKQLTLPQYLAMNDFLLSSINSSQYNVTTDSYMDTLQNSALMRQNVQNALVVSTALVTIHIKTPQK